MVLIVKGHQWKNKADDCSSAYHVDANSFGQRQGIQTNQEHGSWLSSSLAENGAITHPGLSGEQKVSG